MPPPPSFQSETLPSISSHSDLIWSSISCTHAAVPFTYRSSASQTEFLATPSLPNRHRVEIPSMSLTVISATHEAAVSGASYRGDCLATCSEDATIRLWDVHVCA